MSHIRHVQINEVLGLEILVERLSNEAASEVYRPIKPLLLRLADLNLLLREKKPCLHWFNEEKSLFYVAVGADGAPFWKSDTATRVYLVSLINLLQRVQSCNDNHLLFSGKLRGGPCTIEVLFQSSGSRNEGDKRKAIDNTTKKPGLSSGLN